MGYYKRATQIHEQKFIQVTQSEYEFEYGLHTKAEVLDIRHKAYD